jgi:hypothetical protein
MMASSSDGPASTTATLRSGSSPSLEATTQPEEPAPTIT